MRVPPDGVLAAAIALAVMAPSATAQPPSPSTAQAPSPSTAQALVESMLEAIKTGSYDSFLASASGQMKAGLGKTAFDGVTAQLAPRLGAGYKAIPLGELKQQGHRVQLWKLVFTDGGDDALVKMAMKDGLVGGFWIQ